MGSALGIAWNCVPRLCVWCLLRMGSDGVRDDVMCCIMLLARVWYSLCDGIPTGSEGDRSGPRVEVLFSLRLGA